MSNLSRRKIFGWFAGLVGAVGGLPALASDRIAVDPKLPILPGIPTAPSFHQWQQWFREHPDLLWASDEQAKVARITIRANELAQPFIAANQQPDTIFDLTAWTDRVTDNVLLKGYKRIQRGPEFGCGLAITRKALNEQTDTELDVTINDAWASIVTATNEGAYAIPEGGATHFLPLRGTWSNGDCA